MSAFAVPNRKVYANITKSKQQSLETHTQPLTNSIHGSIHPSYRHVTLSLTHSLRHPVYPNEKKILTENARN